MPSRFLTTSIALGVLSTMFATVVPPHGRGVVMFSGVLPSENRRLSHPRNSYTPVSKVMRTIAMRPDAVIRRVTAISVIGPVLVPLIRVATLKRALIVLTGRVNFQREKELRGVARLQSS